MLCGSSIVIPLLRMLYGGSIAMPLLRCLYCGVVIVVSSLEYRLSLPLLLLNIVIELPADAEFVCQAAIQRTPERLLQLHLDMTAVF